jgi:arylsulfatase A-like enzyme
VLLDDTGFAQLGCYGSDIDTPNIDALAAGGLQFTNFHVTPLCSPTRASLLTGRAHHHAVGMRAVSNFRTGFPNQLGHISNHAATVAEVLRDEGYATFCVGKWHLAPMEQCSAAGPFDQWPLAAGFDRFYGFLEGETDQFHPELVADNHPVDPPAGPEDGYHLSEDLVDQALRMIADSTGVRPDRRSSPTSPSGPPTPRTRRHPSTWPSTAAASTRAGTSCASAGSSASSSSASSPRHRARAPQPRRRAVGRAPREPAAPGRRRLQEAFAAFLDHTDVQIGRFVDGLRAWASSTTHPRRARRQRRLPGGRPLRRACTR